MGKLLAAFLIMLVLPLLLAWIPIPGFGGLVGGGLGGYVAGRPGRAAVLALLPFVLLAALIVVVGFGVGVPLVGYGLAGVALVWLVIHHVALLLGALAGGLAAMAAEAQDWSLREWSRRRLLGRPAAEDDGALPPARVRGAELLGPGSPGPSAAAPPALGERPPMDGTRGRDAGPEARP